MYASEAFLQILVVVALGITIISPMVFLALLVRDMKGGKIW